MKIGDKPASFVNSHEWIGSQEVGYVLGSLLDIYCKYIIIDKGSEAKKFMNQLRDHFMNQATPVMIGGGVLAFTCIGIWIHPTTHDTKLLILVAVRMRSQRRIRTTPERTKSARFCRRSSGWRAISGLAAAGSRSKKCSKRTSSIGSACPSDRSFIGLFENKHRRSSILQNNQRLWLRFLAMRLASPPLTISIVSPIAMLAFLSLL